MSEFCELPTLLRLQQARLKLEQLQQLEGYFGDLNDALSHGQSAWKESHLLSAWQLQQLFADDIEMRVEQALQWAQQEAQSWIGFGSPDYPELLAEIKDAPIILGVRGDVSLLKDPQIAVVGSRHASKVALQTAQDFASHLSKSGITITSGMALGVDAAAHSGGLKGQGRTIAVVGTGLDRIYPAANQALAREIAQQGAMISEFPLGTAPLAQNFPMRNRIISGLSVGTLVVEAALKSGSLITARMALEQGREVFAIPGSIHNPQAKGCHQLIKQGAKLVESGQDVFEELMPQLQGALDFSHLTPQPSALSRPQKRADSKLLSYIEYEPISLEELAVVSKMPVSALQTELMMLELSGTIEKLSAGRWRRLQ